MRTKGLWVAIIVIILGAAAVAANDYGVKNKRDVTFSEALQVGNTVLPAGNYQITHQMQGNEHLMTFRQMGTRKPVEVQVKCKLVPLKAPATQTEISYKMNGNERLLTRMVFQGESAAHEF